MINYTVIVLLITLFILHFILSVYCYGLLQHFCVHTSHKNNKSYTIGDRLGILLFSLVAPVIGITIHSLFIYPNDYKSCCDFTIIGGVHDKIDFQIINLSNSINVWNCDKIDPNYFCKNDGKNCMLCGMLSHYK